MYTDLNSLLPLISYSDLIVFLFLSHDHSTFSVNIDLKLSHVDAFITRNKCVLYVMVMNTFGAGDECIN